MRRGTSNPKKSQASAVLESETAKMEEKLLSLKQAMSKQKDQREDNMRTSGSRWKAAATDLPLKNYATKVLEKKETPKQPVSAAPAESQTATSKTSLRRPSFTKNEIKKPPPSSQSNRKPLSRPGSNMSLRSQGSRIGKENNSQMENTMRKSFNDTSSITSEGRPPSSLVSSLKKKSEMTSMNGSDVLSITPRKNISRKQIAQTKLNDLQKSIVKQPNIVESNLQRHLAQQKEIQKEVHQFLASINLTQYIKVFEDNGFDDLETIEEISTEYMNSMKIPAGHQIKITSRLEFLKNEKVQVEQLHRKKELKDSVHESSKIKNIVLYPREEIKKKQVSTETKVPQNQTPTASKKQLVTKAQATRAEAAPQENKEGGELLQGTFDEEESHKSFLEALMQFRGQKKQEEQPIPVEEAQPPQVKKGVRFTEDTANNEGKGKIQVRPKQTDDGAIRGRVFMIIKEEEDQEKELKNKEKIAPSGGFFFSSIGNNDWSNSEYPSSQDAGINAGDTRLPKREVHRISCYQCFKLVEVGTEVSFNIKNFCSDKCLSTYKGATTITCECGKSILKENCCFVRGKWHCTEACALKLAKSNKKEYELEEENSNLEQDIDLNFDFDDSKSAMTLEELEIKYRGRNISKEKQKKK